jgi:two-component system, chemotaxis family, CheB/CheR fusion protein
MPQPNRKKSSARRRQKSARNKSGALKEQFHDVTDTARVAEKKSARLARESKHLLEAAQSLHEGIETVHHNVDKTHHDIEELGMRRPAKPTPRPGKSFLVVGVGASAGGYEAFVQLLENLRPDLGMAFVFIQHLDPLHESKLAPLLSRATKMTVAEIRDRTRITPNKIHVIPPNRSLTIANGVLHLTPRKKGGSHLPVDHFFESLALDQGNLAVGIVLSGNGHDGTAGLQHIKASGGITFSQDLRTAKYPGMPESAEASDCVDYVLSPASIAEELARIARNRVLKRVRHASAEPVIPGAEDHLHRIFSLLRFTTGVDFSHYKLTTLKRRIMRRMVLKKLDHLADYVVYLQKNAEEVELLFRDILINVTGFFRDPAAFQALRKKIFPRLIKQRAPGAPIRIWVPGCATGEEVYSLAICLHEFLGKNRNNKAIQIFGTDISEAMVARSRSGVYPRSIESQVSPERMRRYFQKTNNGNYQISKFIRDVCIFAKQNVAEDPPFSKLDLISCRNLLIYLGLPLQKKVLPTFHYSLRPGGFLMLGTSETIGTFSNLFSLVDKRNKIYGRSETFSRPEIDFAAASSLESGSVAKEAGPKMDLGKYDLQEKAEEVLLSQYCPPSVIINERMDVLHFLGKTGSYLEPARGTASLNLLKMVRDEFNVDLRTAVSQAAKTNLTVRKEPIRIRFNGHFSEISLEVVPFKSSLSERFFLVLFRDVSGGVIEETKPGRKHAGSMLRQQQAERETQRLRQELDQTKESLQTIIEEQEATNEELKSANEEIQSSNEELQSTNEELETAKEELQSTNEELTTLNEELQNRNMELSQANNDLNNLISSFSMPIIMLGTDLTIRRFTPLGQKLFNLIPSDVGRRISDINPNITLPDLKDLVAEVIETLNVKEIEVQDREGHWYSLRVRPYRTAENKIEGAILVLVDIGEVRQGLEEMLQMIPDPMLLLNGELQVSKANAAFYERFKATPATTEQKSIFKLGSGQWNISVLRSLLESVLPTNQHVENFRVEHDFPEVGRRVYLVNARRLYHHSKGTHYILVLFREVSPQKPGMG